jgi:hypothetical protein
VDRRFYKDVGPNGPNRLGAHGDLVVNRRPKNLEIAKRTQFPTQTKPIEMASSNLFQAIPRFLKAFQAFFRKKKIVYFYEKNGSPSLHQ